MKLLRVLIYLVQQPFIEANLVKQAVVHHLGEVGYRCLLSIIKQYRIMKLQQQLPNVKTYKEWQRIAAQIDLLDDRV